MKYILNGQELSEMELSALLLKAKEHRKSRIARKYGLHSPIIHFKIILEERPWGEGMWIGDDDLCRIIERAKEYFSYQKTDFTIYLTDTYYLYETIKKERTEND